MVACKYEMIPLIKLCTSLYDIANLESSFKNMLGIIGATQTKDNNQFCILLRLEVDAVMYGAYVGTYSEVAWRLEAMLNSCIAAASCSGTGVITFLSAKVT